MCIRDSPIKGNDYGNHVYECGSRTTKCDICGENIIMRNLNDHQEVCIINQSLKDFGGDSRGFQTNSPPTNLKRQLADVEEIEENEKFYDLKRMKTNDGSGDGREQKRLPPKSRATIPIKTYGQKNTKTVREDEDEDEDDRDEDFKVEDEDDTIFGSFPSAEINNLKNLRNGKTFGKGKESALIEGRSLRSHALPSTKRSSTLREDEVEEQDDDFFSVKKSIGKSNENNNTKVQRLSGRPEGLKLEESIKKKNLDSLVMDKFNRKEEVSYPINRRNYSPPKRSQTLTRSANQSINDNNHQNSREENLSLIHI
eukprot:TRINITY_DN31586_c0_g1_i1.p1 TRINITY_DN31586_c0_g1~~TRINITY_DN31586_c0_g1_i1.p1  ORF type:complete len:336 (+),score=73.27 TRINITY_DN31586_c0_g1_i1:74-1009(+)